MKPNNIKVFQKDVHEGQFQYLGRWVNKEFFRAFVYNEKNEEKLANSYREFEDLISSGLWFSSKDNILRKRKKKDDILCSTSE